MASCPTIETKRLILRPFSANDLASYSTMLDTPDLRSSLRIPNGEGISEAWTCVAWWLGQ
jgi:RimJ/RimL family protein N-acetyltransferase